MYPAIHLSVESLTSGQSLFVQGAATAAIAIPQYDELFGNNLDQKLAVVHLLKRNLEEKNFKGKRMNSSCQCKNWPG